MITRHLRITGRVQGVGFRYALCDEAERLGLTGWVRNRTDGSVEAVVQGPPGAVEAIVAWTRRGPPGSRVADVSTAAAAGDFDRPYARFDLRPSA